MFVTTYRPGMLDDPMLGRCEQVIRDVCADLREFNGEDHVHLLVHHPPTIAVSRQVNSLDGVSCRHLRAEHTDQINRARTHGHLWSPSNFAASRGAAPQEIVKDYIRGQKRPDQEGLPPRSEGRGFRPRSMVSHRAESAQALDSSPVARQQAGNRRRISACPATSPPRTPS
jgi:putative transposase